MDMAKTDRLMVNRKIWFIKYFIIKIVHTASPIDRPSSDPTELRLEIIMISVFIANRKLGIH